jgi:hypothetical protein
MSRQLLLILMALILLGAVAAPRQSATTAAAASPRWEVHQPIAHGNLQLFPVTADALHDASGYLTLEEGLRSGEVEVTELGAAMIRRRPGTPPPDRAQVNTLVLINNSKRPLVLLAGEIVTGGKQDRVISKDRIIPPGGDPLPLDVFCVEPGRWHGASASFGSFGLAAPAVRQKAAVAKDQQEVWNATAEARRGVAETVTVTESAGAAHRELESSSSYAQMEASPTIKRQLDSATDDLQQDYERSLKGALRGKNVVGVVVGINGEVVWADLFSDGDLFQRYWSKLLRSYIVEAMSAPHVVQNKRINVAAAEQFLAEQEGKQVIEVEPGEYRLLQVDTARYTIFQLSSLLEKGEPMLHFNKLRKEDWKTGKRRPGPLGPIEVNRQPSQRDE